MRPSTNRPLAWLRRPAGALLTALILAASARAENPFVTSLYTADPAGHVFTDGRLWVYTSHDEGGGGQFVMKDWRAYSTSNLDSWTDHGAVASLATFSWATADAWAPDCVQRNGLFYLYVPMDRTKIGVAVSSVPQGPFVDAVGAPLVHSGMANAPTWVIDPAVFVDGDGQAYLYFGNPQPKVVKLASSMTALAGPILSINGIPDYFEAPWLHKRGSTYYLSYSDGMLPSPKLLYATSSSPLGPFTPQGTVLGPAGPNTSHGSIVKKGASWYLLYHTRDLPGGSSYRRSVAADRLFHGFDGAIGTVVPTLMGLGTKLRLDAGAPSAGYTASTGSYWYRDQAYTSSSTHVTTAAISGTVDDVLYRTHRFCEQSGAPCAFEYTFAVPDASYTVSLHFAETFHAAPGMRRFDVWIDQTQAIANLDVYAAVGRNAALVRTFTRQVSGGEVALRFEPGSAGAPMVSAIEIVRSGPSGLGGR